MIRNINDLVAFQEREFISLGSKDFFKNIVLTIPGCSESEIQVFKNHKMHLPLSYIEIIKKINVNGKVIGYFSLSPSASDKYNFIEELIESYKDSFFPREFMEKHRMYQIGSYNTDLLCVTEGTDHFKEGEILYVDEGYDIYNPEDSQIRKIAKDFEQFLIVAGNLEEIHADMRGNETLYEQKKQEFIERLKALNVSEEYYNAWLNVF